MEVSGIRSFIGEICQIKTTSGSMISAEVVGFRDQYSLLMPWGI